MDGVKCGSCGSSRTRVVDSRNAEFRGVQTKRRVRRCHDCGSNTATYEFSEANLARIDKHDADNLDRKILEAAISLSNKLS